MFQRSKNSLVETLIANNEFLRGRLDLVEAELRQTEESKRFLEFKLAQIQKIQEPTPSTLPLYFSEEEEDADFALKNGIINKQAYEDILEAAGFSSAEIDFAAEDYPRLNTLSSR